MAGFSIVRLKPPLFFLLFLLIYSGTLFPFQMYLIPVYRLFNVLGLYNTRIGLILIYGAICTPFALFVYCGFYTTIPKEVEDAAKIDGAGPLRFFWQMVLPLSRTNIAALFVILFIYGWNQYLWPLLITTSRSMETIVIGIVKMIGTSDAQPDWNIIMATAILAMLPPVAVVIFMQHWFVKGLIETEK